MRSGSCDSSMSPMTEDSGLTGFEDPTAWYGWSNRALEAAAWAPFVKGSRVRPDIGGFESGLPSAGPVDRVRQQAIDGQRSDGRHAWHGAILPRDEPQPKSRGID